MAGREEEEGKPLEGTGEIFMGPRARPLGGNDCRVPFLRFNRADS